MDVGAPLARRPPDAVAHGAGVARLAPWSTRPSTDEGDRATARQRVRVVRNDAPGTSWRSPSLLRPRRPAI